MGLVQSRCSEHVSGETGRGERKRLILKHREPRKSVASFIRQRLKSLKKEREWM